MKAILEFNLPEEETEFKEATNGGMFKHALWQLDQHLRGKLKYEQLADGEYECYDRIRTELYRILNTYNLNIEEWHTKSLSKSLSEQ